MKCSVAFLPFLASFILALPPPNLVPLVRRDSSTQTLYGQCGGGLWRSPSPTACGPTASCQSGNQYYSQCTPAAGSVPLADSKSQTLYGRCGGSGWSAPSPTACEAGASCKSVNQYYSQCTPASKSAGSPVSSPRVTPTSSNYTSAMSITTQKPYPSAPSHPTNSSAFTTPISSASASSAPSSSMPAIPPSQYGKVQYAGINIAGCDFGCDINVCSPSKVLVHVYD